MSVIKFSMKDYRSIFRFLIKKAKKIGGFDNSSCKAGDLDPQQTLDNKKFIEFIYQLVLQRAPDKDGFNEWLRALEKGMPPLELFDTITNSEEFSITSHKNKRLTISNANIHLQNTYKHDSSADLKDKLDRLNFIDLKDEWLTFEEIISTEHSEGSSAVNNILKSLYLNKERDEAFDRFKNSYEFYYIHHLLKTLGINTNENICEIGGGAGYLAWALYISGYDAMSIFEPNISWTSGVGYLRSRSDATGLQIYSDLRQWHESSAQYDVIISKACIHHFSNMSHVAASIRQKMRMGGRWVALREQFADTPAELATLLSEHDYCQKFKLYEWGYSAAQYVEAFEMVGLQLESMVPAFYANDCIGTNLENAPTDDALAFTEEIDKLIQITPEITVERFWNEHYARRNNTKVPVQYTRPQAMIFKKIPV